MVVASQRVIARHAAIAAALLGIALATLYPRRGPSASGIAFCLPCGELGTLDFLLNVALFAPLGALLAWRTPRRANVVRIALWSAFLSLSIEVVQLAAIPGRDASLSDLVANSMGAALGALAVTVAPRLGSPRGWLRLAWGWVIACTSVLTFGVWAVQMYVPYQSYFVQWAPRRPTYAPFLGSLSALSINGLTLGPGEALPPSRIPERFFDGDIALAAHITPGARPNGIALIARIALASGEFLMIGRQHDALVARYRSNAQRAGLRSPLFALEEALGFDSTANRRVEIVITRGTMELRSLAASKTVVRRHRISTARLWAALLPFERGVSKLALLGDLMWLGMLFGPAAYAGARTGLTWHAIVPALTLTGFLALLTLRYQPALLWWPYWGAVSVAAVVGFWLGRRRRPNYADTHPGLTRINAPPGSSATSPE